MILINQKAEKLKKQMKYANSKQIPFVALVGPEEVANNKPALKNMATGEQGTFSIEEVIQKITE
mgnify:CR=1 FL=1